MWSAFLVFTILFGLVSPADYSRNETRKIALIQPNSDPWQGGAAAYRRDLNTMIRLSDRALQEHQDISFVVWPETAFIPRIAWHYRFREDPEMYELVAQLLSYLNKAPVPFVLGNDDAVPEGHTADGRPGRVDYNAVFLFRPGENVYPPAPERYRKMHLVPFTEHFPYRKAFPWIYDLLEQNDTHFWEKGTDPAVFSVDGLDFSTPVCFEDTFGYISRRFVNKGARAIVNLSNDAWANDAVSQYQHLSMAVFRTVENRVPMVRSTASGQTCFIDPNGRILSMAGPFTETYLVGEIPLVGDRHKTLYRIWGDLWGILFTGASVLILVIGILTKLRHI
ncbi:apolipoprotein N-acyltransferase [Brucepastera parasyntrophica]|uniref:apolipoprotein N-acyltransferase n=1 Tax=Brucepastera parasyntrophica TaxID=2880008 RepID=UPI00210CCAD7|nr:apolipoprotein N-acyltransferase [Brucepastera parasyntrophica]